MDEAKDIEAGASETSRGYHYSVSDEQLRVFGLLTPEQRLAWLEEMREFTVAVAPPEAQAWWRRFRAAR